MALPLEGIRVCDLTIIFAGPICTSVTRPGGGTVTVCIPGTG